MKSKGNLTDKSVICYNYSHNITKYNQLHLLLPTTAAVLKMASELSATSLHYFTLLPRQEVNVAHIKE